MKANYLFRSKVDILNIVRLNTIKLKKYTISKIYYTLRNKCDCDFWHICNCNITDKNYEWYLLEETQDIYDNKKDIIERIKTIETNNERINNLKNKRIERIKNGKLNWWEKKLIKRWHSIESIINKTYKNK